MEGTKAIEPTIVYLAIDLVIERFNDATDKIKDTLNTTFAQAFNDQAIGNNSLMQGVNGSVEVIELKVSRNVETDIERGFGFTCFATLNIAHYDGQIYDACKRIENNWKEIVATKFIRMELLTQATALEVIKNKTNAYLEIPN